MSPPVAAPSTATTVQTSTKNVPVAFKHPLDPLTPDEVHHATRPSPRHQALNPTIDHRGIPCGPPSHRCTYRHQSDQIHHTLSVTTAQERCACSLGHRAESRKPTRNSEGNCQESRDRCVYPTTPIFKQLLNPSTILQFLDILNG